MLRFIEKKFVLPSATAFKVAFTSDLLGESDFLYCQCRVWPILLGSDNSVVLTEGGGGKACQRISWWPQMNWHPVDRGQDAHRVQGSHEACVPLSSVPFLQAQMVHMDSHFCTCLWCTSSNTPEFQSRASSLRPDTCHALPSPLVFWSSLLCINKSSSWSLHFSLSLNSLHRSYQFETLPQSFSPCMWVWSGAQLNNQKQVRIIPAVWRAFKGEGETHSPQLRL